MSQEYNIGEIMKFLGKLKKEPLFDSFAFHRALKSRHKIVLSSDFEDEDRTQTFAVVTGKFDDTFCSGMDPLKISENGSVEVLAEIEISFGLLKRLEIDGETSKENLVVIRKVLRMDDES